MAVTITETAAREVWTICKQQNLDPETIHLRVGVKGGGCSGFSYLLDLTENRRDTDEVWEYTYEHRRGDTHVLKVVGDCATGEACPEESECRKGSYCMPDQPPPPPATAKPARSRTAPSTSPAPSTPPATTLTL